MNLHTFKAPTMGEALTQVKSVMGTDAVILHTRTFQIAPVVGPAPAGDGGDHGGQGNQHRCPQRASPAAGGQGAGGGVDALDRRLRTAPAPAAMPRNPVEGGKQIMETPGAQSAAHLEPHHRK